MYFIGFVIIPRCALEEVEKNVELLLQKYCFDPFREKQLEPIFTMAYRLCECRSNKALSYAKTKAREKVGSYSWLKEQFQKENPDAKNRDFIKDERFVQWLTAYREAMEECRINRLDIEPHCPECQGSGRYYTRVNLRDSLEWFHIGHRWHGVITGKKHFYEQYAAPLILNYARFPGGEVETWLSMVGVDEDCEYMETIRDNIADPKDIPLELVPVVVVTPDGKWHMESQYCTDVQWMEKIQEFKETYGGGDYWAVACAMKD